MKDIHYIQSGFETQNKMYRPPQERIIQTLQDLSPLKFLFDKLSLVKTILLLINNWKILVLKPRIDIWYLYMDMNLPLH